MESFFAAADNLDNLLDELENSEEQLQKSISFQAETEGKRCRGSLIGSSHRSEAFDSKCQWNDNSTGKDFEYALPIANVSTNVHNNNNKESRPDLNEAESSNEQIASTVKDCDILMKIFGDKTARQSVAAGEMNHNSEKYASNSSYVTPNQVIDHIPIVNLNSSIASNPFLLEAESTPTESCHKMIGKINADSDTCSLGASLPTNELFIPELSNDQYSTELSKRLSNLIAQGPVDTASYVVQCNKNRPCTGQTLMKNGSIDHTLDFLPALASQDNSEKADVSRLVDDGAKDYQENSLIGFERDVKLNQEEFEHFWMDIENDIEDPSRASIIVPSFVTNSKVAVDCLDHKSSEEDKTKPVSEPFTCSIVSTQGSPTFPLRRLISDQSQQNDLSIECKLENNLHSHNGIENLLDVDINASAEELSNGQHCYPETPPPPYSDEMHATYERVLLPAADSSHGQEPIVQRPDEMQIQGQDTEYAVLPNDILNTIIRPGETRPDWIPDQDAPQCNNCAQKFTFTRRRHHCRACGRVFCTTCCNDKAHLKYLENKEARVCLMCSLAIKQADAMTAHTRYRESHNHSRNIAKLGQHQASSIPKDEFAENSQIMEQVPLGQPASHLQVEVSRPDRCPITTDVIPDDLETESAFTASTATKSVRFSDGTKPAHPDEAPSTPPPPSRFNRSRKSRNVEIDHTDFSLTTLPPVIIAHGENNTFAVQENPDFNLILGLLESQERNPQTFVLNPNLVIHIKFVSYVGRQCWCYWSEGMDCVGQREIVVLLERQGLGDRHISKDIFSFYKHIFNRARKGKIYNTADFMPKSAMGVDEESVLFGLERNNGFLFIQVSSQSLDGLSCLKKRVFRHSGEFDQDKAMEASINGMLFAILVQKAEVSLATLFPLRLMLRLGLEMKQYPCPLFSIRQREPVFQQIGHTILTILCDFNNFKYKIVGIPGFRVVLSWNGRISVLIPRNRFRDTMRVLNSSNESVVAIGSSTYGPNIGQLKSISSASDAPCDSHLVCVQNHENNVYHTEILTMKSTKSRNIAASFVIFNGSLKSGSSQRAKCAIVEDGVMLQLLPEKMEALKASLKSMQDFQVSFGSTSHQDMDGKHEAGEDSLLEVRWIDDDDAFNLGMSSPIDGTAFDGVIGFNVLGKSEQRGRKHILRWNQVFFLESTNNPLDLSRLAEQVANGCFVAFTPVIHELVKYRMHKIGVRVTIHPENVGYVAGAGQTNLPTSCMNSLDEQLIQIIHGAANSVSVDQEAVVFELLFSVLLTKPSYRLA